MPAVYPFNAIQYDNGKGEVSAKVAPPYDVLDAAAKKARLDADAKNVVAIDLPHVPAKELGPPKAYSGANDLFQSWLNDGTLTKRDTPAIFAYRQTFEAEGKTYQRAGMACTLEVNDFGPREGGGVLPHEQTFSGPKEDRMALMKATKAQMSPIFGLHADEAGVASELTRSVMASRAPDMTADLSDGVKHEVWTIEDDATITAYQTALKGEPVFIADGHHRYTTGLNYLRSLEAEGEVPADHPARRCMFVLVGMSDPGLYIGPTHRVLGGMEGYSIDKFQEAAQGTLQVDPCDNDPHKFDHEIARVAARNHENVVGILDFDTGLCFTATPATADPLDIRFPDKSRAWRTLDVAITQHVIVEEICEPELNNGNPVKWAFPHAIDEVLAIGRGEEKGSGGGSGFKPQLAVILRPTPMQAVKEVSDHNELMPQKSTFFFPKLATGLFINPLA